MKQPSQNFKRYLAVMVIGALMNLLLPMAVRPLNLPLGLDMSGTALAAVVLEPAAGIILGFLNNFISSIQQGDPSTVIYFALSAATAVISGVLLHGKRKSLPRVLAVMGLSLVVLSVLSATFTMWRTGGRSDLYWQRYFFDMLRAKGLPVVVSCFVGAFIQLAGTVTASTAVTTLVYLVLPKSLKTES